MGLLWNFMKCEQISTSIASATEPIGQFSHSTTNIATLFGAYLITGLAVNSALGKKLDDLKRASKC